MEISIICDTGGKFFEKRCRLRKTNKRTRCVKNECFSARDILWGRIKHYEKSSLRSHYRFRCALTSVPTPFGFLLLRKKNTGIPYVAYLVRSCWYEFLEAFTEVCLARQLTHDTASWHTLGGPLGCGLCEACVSQISLRRVGT